MKPIVVGVAALPQTRRARSAEARKEARRNCSQERNTPMENRHVAQTPLPSTPARTPPVGRFEVFPSNPNHQSTSPLRTLRETLDFSVDKKRYRLTNSGLGSGEMNRTRTRLIGRLFQRLKANLCAWWLFGGFSLFLKRRHLRILRRLGFSHIWTTPTDRARRRKNRGYSEELLGHSAEDLTARRGRGFSVQNLGNIREENDGSICQPQ